MDGAKAWCSLLWAPEARGLTVEEAPVVGRCMIIYLMVRNNATLEVQRKTIMYEEW